MKLQRLTEAFLIGFASGRSRTYPYLWSCDGELSIMHDAERPQHKGYRRTEIVDVDGDPVSVASAAAELADRIGPAASRWFLCAIRTEPEDELAHIESEYKRLGFRLTAREVLFSHSLQLEAPAHPVPHEISTIRSREEAADFFRQAGLKLNTYDWNAIESGQVRRYVCRKDGEQVGSVASVQAGEKTRWVSALWVHEEHRRRGIGTALMRALLQGDSDAGDSLSVLLASKDGAQLYPTLGYERKGTLLLYQKPKT